MREFMTRCAQRHGSSAFARTSLVVFALAVCAAEISAAMPARLLRSSAPDRAFNSAGARAENAAAKITSRRFLKTTPPDFVEKKINKAGTGTYDIRQLDEDANPQPFEVSAPLAQRIFALAAKLNNFQNVDLDVHRRLANLGAKSLVYEKGGEKPETAFNYTLDDAASQLVNIFEGLARQTTDLSDLVRTMRYDHLGVNDVMQQIERDYNSKLLPEPDRLLSTLDQLAADEKFIDLARTRARNLATRIRSSH